MTLHVSLLQGMVHAWEDVRGRLDQYGMQHTRAFANLCNSGVAPSTFRESVTRTTPTASLAGLVEPDAVEDIPASRAHAFEPQWADEVDANAAKLSTGRPEIEFLELNYANVVKALMESTGGDIVTITVAA